MLLAESDLVVVDAHDLFAAAAFSAHVAVDVVLVEAVAVLLIVAAATAILCAVH